MIGHATKYVLAELQRPLSPPQKFWGLHLYHHVLTAVTAVMLLKTCGSASLPFHTLSFDFPN